MDLLYKKIYVFIKLVSREFTKHKIYINLKEILDTLSIRENIYIPKINCKILDKKSLINDIISGIEIFSEKLLMNNINNKKNTIIPLLLELSERLRAENIPIPEIDEPVLIGDPVPVAINNVRLNNVISSIEPRKYLCKTKFEDSFVLTRFNNTNSKRNNAKLGDLMGNCKRSGWLPNSSSEDYFSYVLLFKSKRDNYLGHITYSGNIRFSTYFGSTKEYLGSTITGYETSSVCIHSDLRGLGFLEYLMYKYLNDSRINSTWLWTSDKQTEYFSYGFEYLYKSDTNSPLKSGNNYLMRYNKNKKIGTIEEFNSKDNSIIFSRIPVVDQNSERDGGLCGIYVIINSIIITNIAKYYNNDISFLTNKTLTRSFRDTIKQLIFNYLRNEKPLINSMNKKDTRVKRYNVLKEYFTVNRRPININRNKSTHITEANGMIKFMHSDGIIEHLHIINDGKYFNLDLFEQHVIIVENDLSSDGILSPNRIFSPKCFINDNNLKIMKNFYNLDNYIVTFIIGDSGHWKCYTINKYMSADGIKYQYIYLDSLNGRPDLNIAHKLKAIVHCESFEDFLTNIYNESRTINIDADSENTRERQEFFVYSSKYSTFFTTI